VGGHAGDDHTGATRLDDTAELVKGECNTEKVNG
jgi:hypothetical protein